ncbi:DNA mismatch repair protein MutS [bacterium]|nr:DNA mismatch repair protein MutS [bacterium]
MSKKESKNASTPLMEQYYRIKQKYPDAILFFRMGDFYEMFEDDAEVASKVLGITLTSRGHGMPERTPLAGVPYHASDKYLSRLLDAGYKVAICEQVEDPKQAKGLVKREVIEVMSPGTITLETPGLGISNNYLLSIYPNQNKLAYSCADLMTGQFFTKEIHPNRLLNELTLLEPREILLPTNSDEELVVPLTQQFPDIRLSYFEEWKFNYDYCYQNLLEHFGTASLEGFGNLSSEQVQATGALIAYLKELKKGELKHLSSLSAHYDNDFMVLDNATVRNLELVRSLMDGSKKYTLYSELDDTQTPMGSRLIRQWILKPMTSPKLISDRLNAVETLYDNWEPLNQIREGLKHIGDLERLVCKLGNLKANPRDLLSLAEALQYIPPIKSVLATLNDPTLKKINENLHDLTSLKEQIENAISPDCPLNLNEGRVFRTGINEELDELREIARGGKNWIKKFGQQLREETGIPKLKLGYNKVFGYYIEVTKAHLDKVPDFFQRKQTLVNSERYITPELKEYEVKVLSADERAQEIERTMFINFRNELAHHAPEILLIANFLAELDVLSDFAFIAHKKKYVKPLLSKDGVIKIEEGRHPVIEGILGEAEFVPNDTYLSNLDHQILVVTGPNMSGKSTFLRQVALIVLMAQLGSFVPASKVMLTPVDRIFTRVGAHDNIARGQSTFLVEMIETATILNNANDNSLILLDEIGRGTSTFDGLSIAWATTEYLHNHPGRKAKTIFATHYHELTYLSKYLPRVKNFQVVVKEWKDKVIFLHRIVEGGCDDSYGIQVAKLAGVPQAVLDRANQILNTLETDSISSQRLESIQPQNKKGKQDRIDAFQISLFEPEYHPLFMELKKIEPLKMTPLEALAQLQEWKEKWDIIK